MRRLSRPLVITLMAATLPVSFACAEDGPAPDKPAFEKNMPSDETLARLEDGRIAFAKAALKLTADQEKFWAPVEAKIRANFDERQKVRGDWKAKREEWKAKAKEAKAEKPSLPEQLEKRSERLTKSAEWMTKRAAKTKELADVMKPLYASLTEEQKAVASRALDPFLGGKEHGPRGPRWAGGFGHHDWNKGPKPE